jgi:hypothetical protein
MKEQAASRPHLQTESSQVQTLQCREMKLSFVIVSAFS